MPGSKYLTTPVKLLIAAEKEKGKTDRAVALQFGTNQKTVSRIYQRYKQTSNVSRKSKPGRPRKLDTRQQRSIVRMHKVDPNKSSRDLVDAARRLFNVSLSRWTAQRILNRHKLFAATPAKKPLTVARHRRARIEFCRAHRSWTSQQWGKVLWSDESKFNLFNSDGRSFIRRPPNMRYNPRFIRPTVKFGGGSINVWGISQFPYVLFPYPPRVLFARLRRSNCSHPGKYGCSHVSGYFVNTYASFCS